MPFCSVSLISTFFFFFNDTATTEIYTLSLHDALPICARRHRVRRERGGAPRDVLVARPARVPLRRRRRRGPGPRRRRAHRLERGAVGRHARGERRGATGRGARAPTLSAVRARRPRLRGRLAPVAPARDAGRAGARLAGSRAGRAHAPRAAAAGVTRSGGARALGPA